MHTVPRPLSIDHPEPLLNVSQTVSSKETLEAQAPLSLPAHVTGSSSNWVCETHVHTGMVPAASVTLLRLALPPPPTGGDGRPEDSAPLYRGRIHFHRCGSGRGSNIRRLGSCLGLQKRRGARWLLSAWKGQD